MTELGLDLDELLEQEEEPGLGNGGLGRLAACFLDSLATLEIPAIGYGIRYEFGIFDQEIRDGWQVEVTDKWLRFGNPWEIARPELALRGQVRRPHRVLGRRAAALPRALDARARGARRAVRHAHPRLPRRHRATPCGCGRPRRASRSTSRPSTSATTIGAVDEKIVSENITKVLYPNDEPRRASELRLEQQYFFVACSLQDMLRILDLAAGRRARALRRAVRRPAQRHPPAIAVAELMRLLVDEHRLDWERGLGDHAARRFGYTNHTLLPEALETLAAVAVRQRCCRATSRSSSRSTAASSTRCARRYPGRRRAARRGCRSSTRTARSSVRMAHLACVGSHAINGVAALHTRAAARRRARATFAELWPGALHQHDQRRDAAALPRAGQPGLGALITEHHRRRLGHATSTSCGGSSRSPTTPAFRRALAAVKRANKARARRATSRPRPASRSTPTRCSTSR